MIARNRVHSGGWPWDPRGRHEGAQPGLRSLARGRTIGLRHLDVILQLIAQVFHICRNMVHIALR
jgi:hypothetical protein